MKFKTFCAANSGDGFISLFDSILDEKSHQIYYIKGGPGCGKSTLIREIAAQSKQAELIHCSGDPASLDGVILPEQKAVIIDATAPHSHEPKYPGIGGTIVDLSEVWDPNKLNKNVIISLTDHKKTVYKTCYSLLNAAKQIHSGVFSPLSAHISSDKIHSLGNKILCQNGLWKKRSDSCKIQKRFISAITPMGCITYDETISSLGRDVIILEDRWMVAHLLLQYLEKKLSENGIDHVICCHPLLGKSTIQHLIIPEINLSIVSKDGIFPVDIPEEQIVRKITLQAMLDKDYMNSHKNKLAFIKRLLRETVNLAIENLQNAREIHLKIEQEYAKGSDYSRIKDIKEKLMTKLFTTT